MKLSNFAFLPPLDEIKKDFTNRIQRDYPNIEILAFEDESEVIARANDTDFGLAAGVFTENNGIALRVSKAVRAGIVFVNTYRLISPIAPFGGFKNSGFGRESGMEAIKDYSNIKTTWINTSTEPMGDPFIIR